MLRAESGKRLFLQKTGCGVNPDFIDINIRGVKAGVPENGRRGRRDDVFLWLGLEPAAACNDRNAVCGRLPAGHAELRPRRGHAIAEFDCGVRRSGRQFSVFSHQ